MLPFIIGRRLPYGKVDVIGMDLEGDWDEMRWWWWCCCCCLAQRDGGQVEPREDMRDQVDTGEQDQEHGVAEPLISVFRKASPRGAQAKVHAH